MKKVTPLYLLILFFSLSSKTQAQYWLRNFGSTLNDEGTDISIDAAGNTYTTGYFSATVNFGGTPLASNGLTDVFIVKTDPSGVVLWAQKGGGSGSDRGLGIKTDAAGNCYVTGFFTGSATFGSTTLTATAGSQDVFVAKYNSAGVLQWAKSGGGPQADIGYAVNVDNNGNVGITGQFKATASFGSFSQTSMIDPATSQPSGDIFIVKYNSTGTEQWFKAGKAKKDDWGTDISCSSGGDFYITGHFSDTITFDNTHNNQMLNAAFLVKYNSAGAEQWFRRMGGTQTSSYAIATDNSGNIYLAGDFLGSLSFFNGSALVSTLTNPYSDKIFIAKYDASGTLIWSRADGSDSEVSCRNLAIDNNNDPYVVGYFKCRMGDYADLYGQGTFNSVGFRDIFVTRYNAAGVRQWARSCGGQKDDNPGGICVNTAGEVFIAGSFETRILFASDVASPTGFSVLGPLFNVVNGAYCNDANYGIFTGLTSQGAMDIMVAKNINFTREPYDYYWRGGSSGCSRPFVEGCINTTGNDYDCGPDTLQLCGTPLLNAATNTSFVGPFNYSNTHSAGPDFTYLWSTGATTKVISAPGPGYYSVQMTTVDGCFTSTDSVFVIINSGPPSPTITDSKGINYHVSITDPIELCEPDSVTLWGGNYGSLSHSWSGTPPTFMTVNAETIKVFESGTYYFTVTDANGCASSVLVNVTIDGDLDSINPAITIYQPQPINDTIKICPGGNFSILVYDSITNPAGMLLPQPIEYSCPSSTWAVTPACSFFTGSPHCNLGVFSPTQTGTYTVTYTLIRQNVCDSDTVVLSIPVNILIYPQPTAPTLSITGPTNICPGDTVTLTASGGSNYTWSGPGIIGPTNGNSIQVNQSGGYSVSVTVTNQYGCTASSGASHLLPFPAAPFITMNPPNGIICPGGQVTITVQMAGTYQWYGPNGLMPNTTAFINVTQGGFYYCVVTINGCPMVSNTVEVKQYTTPVLTAQPTSVICPGDSVVIQVQAVATTNIQWSAPLSGNSLTQTIYTPGTYVCSITSCGITTTDTIQVTQGNPQATIQPTGSFTLCDLDTLTLSSNPQSAYQWIPGGQTTQSIDVTDPGTYSVIITDPFGCKDTSVSVNVAVLPPVATPAVTDLFICAGAAPLLTATAPGTIHWFNTPTGGTPLATGPSYQAPSLNAPTTYYVQNTDAGNCESVRVPLNVFLWPSSIAPPIFVNNTQLCEGDTIQFWTNALAGGNYTWSGPDNFSSTAQMPDPIVATAATQGTYFLSVGDANCNSPITSITITVTPIPAAPSLIAPCEIVCSGKSVELNASSPSSSTFTWQTPTGTSVSASPLVIPDASVSDTGTYVVYTSVGNCLSAPVSIYIDVDDCNLVIPNVFSPNGDQLNLTFRAEHAGLIQMHCIIFNRWGNKIYEWDGPNGFWDGTSDGEKVPEGVYYVLMEYSFCTDDETRHYEGFVHVVR